MKRTVKYEFATFLTPAGVDLMSRVMRGEATMKFDKCRIGSGLWAVKKIADDEFEVDVPDQLLQPIDGGLFDIDSLEPKGTGVSEARVNVPPTFGPATITEAEWLLDDDTVYAISRSAPVPVLPVGSGSSSEVTLRAFLRVGDVDAVTLVIDSGVTASREYVDTEVGKVDQSLKARADQLDARVDDLPVSYLVTPPVVTGDAEQAYGNNATLSVSGGVSSWHNTAAAATIDHYEWVKPDKTTVQGPTLIWPIPNDAALVDTVYPFKVRAVDTLGNKSDWVAQDVKVVGNRRPVVTGFTHDVPAVAVKNQAVAVKFSGATDPDGDDAQMTYRITSPINVTASKSTGIDANETVTLTFADVAENTTAGITVVAVDQAGTQSAPTVITVDLRHQAIVEKPTGLAPAAGAADIAQQPNIAGTAFAVNPAGFGTHSATKIRVATDADMTNVVTTMALGAVTSAQVDTALALDTQHWYQLQYEAGALGWSDWSEPVAFTTAAAELPQNVFSTDLYTGQGSSQSITNEIDLVNGEGLVWFKERSGAGEHRLVNTIQGPGRAQCSNSGGSNYPVSGLSFGSEGFDLSATDQNWPGGKYVAWTFRKAPRFFDVKEYRGNGAVFREIDHELDCAVGMVIIRRTDGSGDWYVWHRGLAPGSYIALNSAAKAVFGSVGVIFGDGSNYVAPDDSAVTVGSNLNIEGATYVAYFFAHDSGDSGIIQCGSYMGDSTFSRRIDDLGWEPQFLIIKEASTVFSGTGWGMFDAERGMSPGNDPFLFANRSDDEDAGVDFVDANSTGFYLRNGGSLVNTNNSLYIYMAIRAPIPV